MKEVYQMMKRLFYAVLAVMILCLPVCSAEQASDPEAFRTAGAIVIFGHYEQDGNPENGQEPIEWIVLEAEDGKSLLLSKYVLDSVQYHQKDMDITWEECSLRAWLNSTFLNEAFSETEQAAIILTEMDNYSVYGDGGWDSAVRDRGVSGGNDTQDRIALLSYHEAFELFFPDNEACMCAATAYARSHGTGGYVYQNAEGEYCVPWWLRSAGATQDRAAIVSDDGGRSYCMVVFRSVGVRPICWVDPDLI